jgi:hypothetical protein
MKDTRQESRAVRFQGVDFPQVAHARWALFFEDLQMSWAYRPQTFDVGEYQPDFLLSETRTWFQVGVALHDADHLLWRRFVAAGAAATVPQPGGLSRPADQVPGAALYHVGGIPDAATVAVEHGPRPAGGAAMYSADGSRCQWVFCGVCGWAGVEPSGGSVGHVHGHAVRADAPRLLAAYRLARQANRARETYGTGCARCRTPLALGDLIAAGRKIRNRRWYHAMCLLQSRRERYGTLALPAGLHHEATRVQKPTSVHGHTARTEAA